MMTPDGPRMLEYNVRFGDPETQVVVPRFSSDLTELLAQAAAGRIVDEPTFSDDATVTVVCAAEGYPASPRGGDVISGIDEARALDGVSVYCAGVGASAAGDLVTAGGRVLNVCGRGPTLAEARARAYEGVSHIRWDGMFHRADIARTAAS
jgi:phosphoribosylamine--glycine ligase